MERGFGELQSAISHWWPTQIGSGGVLIAPEKKRYIKWPYLQQSNAECRADRRRHIQTTNKLQYVEKKNVLYA